VSFISAGCALAVMILYHCRPDVLTSGNIRHIDAGPVYHPAVMQQYIDTGPTYHPAVTIQPSMPGRHTIWQ
jgi:hypothetical protein